MINRYYTLTTLNILVFALFFIIEVSNISKAEETFEIKAEKVSYKKNKNVVHAEGNAVAKNQIGETLRADRITYDKKNNVIFTFGNSKYIDEIKNKLTAETLKYNLNSKLIEAKKNVELIDKKGNKILLSKFIYNQNSKRGYGYDIKAFSSDGSYSDAKEGEIDQIKGLTILRKSKYTTCNKIFENGKFCPSWSLTSDQIKHDRKNKKIIHKNSFLKIKNVPVLYTPYLSHPDPSVKRQSGFLPPSIKTISNIGRTLKIPYFLVVSDDKDITITPTYYFNENSLIQTSYRQATKNGLFKAEVGYSQGYREHNKFGRTKGSRNFIFANYKANKKNIFFEKNNIDFNLQRISQENFIKVNKINTSLFDENIRTLENSIRIQSYGNNKRLDIKAGIFENLDKSDNSKYTYFLPDGIFSLNNLKKNYNLNFNSYFQGKKFNNDQKQIYIKNKFSLNGNDYIFNNGFKSKLKFTAFNQNNYNENFGRNDDNLKINNNFSFAIDNQIPFAKFSKDSFQTISPQIFIKHTTGSMQNASSNNKILNFSDIFIMNRTNSLDAVETGTSLGYGINYNLSKNYLNNGFDKKIKTSFGIGQVLRDQKENNMPIKSSLNKKYSDFAGFLKFNFENLNDENKNLNINKMDKKNKVKNLLNIDYKFNLDNNFKTLLRNNLNLRGIYNKHQFDILFDEKSHYIGNNRNLTLSYKKKFNENYFINIENKKDLINDKSEYKRFSINYENDCIITSLSFSKDFYNDKDIRSTKSLIFGITLKPFQQSLGPDLTNFIN